MSAGNIFAPLPPYVKKALGNLKVVGAAAESITAACDDIGLKYESPGLIGDSAVHFVFPKLKAGLLLKAKANNSPSFKHKILKSRKMGWTLKIVTTEDIEVLPQETVTIHLKEFIDFIKSQSNTKEIK